jgi:predicted ATPase/Tfp pilus assembly protein PilF/DNA-binding XRE family transcriptional regulator
VRAERSRKAMEDERPASSSSDFGVLLRRHRLAAGLSQEALAERARMSSDGISALERGHRRTPQRETLGLLADALALRGEERREFEIIASRAPVPRRTGPIDIAVGVSPEGGIPGLPLTLTSFVGRTAELGEITKLVHEYRLVTITGAGGVGKTQTALRVGMTLGASADPAVFFVGLASVGSPSLIVVAVASAVGLREVPGRPLLEALVAYLKGRALLLIFDNCEHVITEAAALVNTLLGECPHLRILATSREPLWTAGERTFRLPSLNAPSPDATRGLNAKEAATYGAIALFADRARAVDHRFTLTDENAPIVADLCRRLDGIPLAIELAAARANLLSIKALTERLDDRFRILTSRERTALPRQQTLRATINWSYDLLSETQQRLFERLAVFSGSAALEAAEAVAPDGALSAPDVFDLLSSLAEKSLVIANVEEGVPRYRLLESTRAFALEKLQERGESAAFAQRHAEWAAQVADRVHAKAAAVPVELWIRELELELENARSAIDWGLSTGHVALAARIASGFARVWRMNRGYAEPYRWVQAVVGSLDCTVERAIAARAWLTLAGLTFGTRRVDAAERALELSDRRDDPEDHMSALYQLAVGLIEAGRIEEAQVVNDRALQLCQQSESTKSRRYADALDVHARIVAANGLVDEARGHYEDALSLMTALGDEHEATLRRLNLGELEYRAGNFERALRFAEAAAQSAWRMRSRHREATALTNAAACHLALGDIEAARKKAQEALEFAQSCPPIEAAAAIQHLATVAALSGDARSGARLCGYVDARFRNERCERGFTERHTHDMLMRALREKLSGAEIETLGTEGALLSEEQVTNEVFEV